MPLVLPQVLPDDWRGAFLLLAIVFVLSSLLDNIAGALIGGAMARWIRVGIVVAMLVAAIRIGADSRITTHTATPMSGKVPAASWQTAFGMGFISAVFDNIPLTKLALDQGGHDWAVLAYCVGFGGSMIWFGSSSGVALSNLFPEARSVGAWIRHGWSVPVAYVVGVFVMLGLLGWHPQSSHRAERAFTASGSPR